MAARQAGRSDEEYLISSNEHILPRAGFRLRHTPHRARATLRAMIFSDTYLRRASGERLPSARWRLRRGKDEETLSPTIDECCGWRRFYPYV